MPEQYSGMWNVLNLRRRAGDSWSQVEDTDTQHRVCTGTGLQTPATRIHQLTTDHPPDII